MTFSHRNHLVAATVLWGLVGLGLLTAGLIILFGGSIGMTTGISLLVGLVLGFIKGKFVISKLGRKNKVRIKSLPEQSPFYMTFSVKSWVMVLGMILLGRVIRLGGAPLFVVGTIYVAVGVALLIGRRVYLREDR